MKRYSLIVVLVSLGGVTQQQQPPTPPSSAVVDALVSSNPQTTGEWTETLPDTWSREEDQRVWTAYDALVEQGKKAVPLLIANLDRKEFSSCIPTSVPYSPQSVGDMCEMAMSDIFDPIGTMYKARENAKGKTLMGYSYFDLAFHSKAQAEKWWKESKHKSVEEIQKMIRDWNVERETSFGFKDKKQKKSILDDIEQRYANRNKKRNGLPERDLLMDMDRRTNEKNHSEQTP
ncbi:MAG: hypothetical protein PVH19_05015 [Planctomycetia bacterium]|jgi:hypothetical protein